MSTPTVQPTLTLEVERIGDVTVVCCHGQLVAGLTSCLHNTVAPLIPQSKRLVLDLADLQRTDSLGLGALVQLYVSAKANGCSLELMHLSKQIRQLLGLTNLFSVFTVIGENGVKLL